MARIPRKFQDASFTLYHIISQGNNQQKIFKFKRDRKMTWLIARIY